MQFKIELWAHQKVALEKAATAQNYALFFEPGTGKTATAINILRMKCNEQKRILRTLIFCPPIVIQNWKSEWLAHSSMPPDQITPLFGDGKRRLDTFFERAWTPDLNHACPQIFITNYESLLMPNLYRQFTEWRPEAIVFDESHKCKAMTSKRTKLALKLANPTTHPHPFKLLLSGSPVLNSPLDLFPQFLLMDGGETFGGNFFAFRGKYFRDKNAGMPKGKHFPLWVINPGALDEINEKLATKSMHVKKKDCLDLPPLVKKTIKVGMLPDQKRMYQEMKRDFITFMDDKAVTATLAMTKALRLMQIASGFAKTTEGEERSVGDTPKMAALKALLEELAPHHKVIVWAVWRENYGQIRRVCDDLQLRYTEVHGDVSGTKKFQNVDDFNNDPECRVLIGHPGSGGIGVNLTASDYSIFFSQNFSLEFSLQAAARNYRGGSEIHEKITHIDIVTEETIEEIVVEKLANKQMIGDKLLRDLSQELRNQGDK